MLSRLFTLSSTSFFSRAARLLWPGVVTACCAGQLFAAAPTAVRFDLAAGPADQALRSFSLQSGRELLFSTEAAQGVRTNAVRGDFPPEEAIARLLAGTDLRLVPGDKSDVFRIIRTSEEPAGKKAPSPKVEPRAERPVTSAAPAEDETVLLSPFQVDASSQKGYLATQTLSGTRLKTDLQDIGSALTIFTEQMMDDLGANSIDDILVFAPNTDAFVTTLTDTGGSGNNFINSGTQFVTRGGVTAVVAQDFFDNNIPADRYNSEAFTFTRGPNSILFGLGNAAGAFVSSTKRAKLNRTETTIELRTDSEDSFRSTLDHNHVIRPGVLAARYAGLYEKSHTFRIPSEGRQRRHFLTLTYKPFQKTTLRINYEKSYLQRPGIRPWPVYDGISTWLNAGRPTLPIRGAPRPASIAAYNQAGLVSTEFSPAGTKLPTQNLAGGGQTAVPNYATGYPSWSGNRSFINPAIYPTEATAFGGLAFRQSDSKVYSLFIEQEITRDFFIEGAYNRNVADLYVVNGFVGNYDFLYADPNQQLPGGIPNPNVGMLYTESQSTLIISSGDSTSKRLMASYDLDFGRQRSAWLRHFGRHRIAAFAEDIENKGSGSNSAIYNTTPLAQTGAAAAITNAANKVYYRYYYDPAAGKVGNQGGRFDRYPVVFANDPLPTPDPSGITPAYIGGQPVGSYIRVKTLAFATQSSFWKDRFILTNGWRTDSQQAWRSVPDDYASFKDDARGIFADSRLYDVRTLIPQGRRESEGRTATHGFVFHALPWLSLTYNTSNNFQANDSTRNVYGELLPNPQGKGSDYGLKLSLLDRRLFCELTYYQNASENRLDKVSTTSAGTFIRFDMIWETIADFTNDQKYRTSPYSSQATTWSDSASSSSEGWEFSVTANPTKQWRFSLNGSKRGASTTTARGVFIRQYMAQYIPLIKANAAWMAYPTTGNIPISSRVADLETVLVNFDAIKNMPEDNYAPRWTLNMIQSYTFDPGTRLAGFAIGGTVNARGRTIDGFAEDAQLVIDPTQPYYAPSYQTFGAWVSYRRKLFRDRIDWRLQLNVRNVLDQNKVFPMRTVDARDGTHRGVVAIYTLREPRTYALTSTFKF